jgi:hypothetical protein
VRHLRGILHSITKCSHRVSQVLLDGENVGPKAIHDARELVITKEQFQAFLKRHEEQACLVPEDNDAMESSYLLLGRVHEVRNVAFLLYSYSHIFCSSSSTAKAGEKVSGKSILEVGVIDA